MTRQRHMVSPFDVDLAERRKDIAFRRECDQARAEWIARNLRACANQSWHGGPR